VKRRHYNLSVSGATFARIAARCAESGFFRSAVVEDACAKELAEGERMIEERRMAKERP
jgi:hypothetical protein